MSEKLETQIKRPRARQIGYTGGMIIFTPHGEFTNRQNEKVEYDDSVTITYGKINSKITDKMVKAIIKVFTTDEKAVAFLSQLPAIEILEID